LGAGAFGWEDTRFTISVLAFMTFGMLAQATIPLLARGFYALQDTKTPLIASVAAVVINIGLALLLIPKLQVVGLGAALAISSLVNMALLMICLSYKVEGLQWWKTIWEMTKMALSAVAMGGAGYLMLRVMDLIIDTHTFWGLLAQTGVTLIVAGLVYLVLAKFLKIAEVRLVISPIKTLWSKMGAPPIGWGTRK
jgi:putative peptidoglycan lipid II flippase